MRPVLLIDVVGLSSRQLGERTPELVALGKRGARAPMSTVLPAVTCSAQATMLTGLAPSGHGAVGNGWLERASGEIAFWRQSNALVAGEKLYEAARARLAGFTCAKLFWWWNLGAAVDWSVTPRPFYPADGRKIPAIYAWPTLFGREAEAAHGPFPFFDFWGPRASLASSAWIAHVAAWTLRTKKPSLTLVYLPHLDYDHQRFGPGAPRSLEALAEVDRLVGELVRAADEVGAETVVVSEYAIRAVSRAVEPNRALRRAGLLVARETPAGEVLDPFGSRAFAVCDHQLAHVYAKDAAAREEAREALAALDGVAAVLGEDEKRAAGLAHERAGELVVLAERDAWLAYPYWLDHAAEPDFARTVDIHRKPGYDPLELVLDPALAAPKLKVASYLLRKKLGLRGLLRVVPLDTSLVKGSHGLVPERPEDGPVFLASRPFAECGDEPEGGLVAMASVKERVLALLAGSGGG
jgi:predicted AlkP superfamily pyrophosphatase or phosphodiesterase